MNAVGPRRPPRARKPASAQAQTTSAVTPQAPPGEAVAPVLSPDGAAQGLAATTPTLACEPPPGPLARPGEFWADLLAAAALPPVPDGPVVVCTAGARLWPLVESRATVVAVHARRTPWTDFRSPFGRHAAPRERLHAADADAVADVLARAALVVLPAEPWAVPLRDAMPADAPVLLWAAARSADDPSWTAWADARHLVRLRAGGLRLAAAPVVGRALATVGVTPWSVPDDAWVAQVLARLAPGAAMQVSLGAVQADEGAAAAPAGLRLRTAGVQMAATAFEALSHHIQVDGHLLATPQGLASLMLPWGGGGTLRLMLRDAGALRPDDPLDDAPVQDDDAQADPIDRDGPPRVPPPPVYPGDSLHLAAAGGRLSPRALLRRDRDLWVTVDLPAFGAADDALLHLALPTEAVPDEDWVRVRAVEIRWGWA